MDTTNHLLGVNIRLICSFVIFLAYRNIACAQNVDFSNCPNCSTADIQLITEVNTMYLGIKGRNPEVPSTYNLIGKHKYNGTGWVILNRLFEENWYPIRTEKQILCGTLDYFAVSEYGDEHDLGFNLLPNPGFENFIEDALPFKKGNWYAHGPTSGLDNWHTDAKNRYLMEVELTPDERRFNTPWFRGNKDNNFSILEKRQMCAYGPFVREESHGNRPEIHPAEIIWFKESDQVSVILLANDDSNRFEDSNHDFEDRNATTPNWKPWTQENGQESEIRIPFEVDISKEESILMSVQALDFLEFSKNKTYPDAIDGNRYSITYKGATIFSLTESAEIDKNVGITFDKVCRNVSKNTIQGFVVLKAAIGNGDGHEGFVALRVEKLLLGKNDKLCIQKSDATGVSWKTHEVYDDKIAFSDVISTDQKGMGIVNGHIDFNGNGITDLFAKSSNGKWMVLYDCKGQWQQLGSSNLDINALRFGDVNGDKKTDILYVSDASEGRKLMVSYGGTAAWAKISDETIAGSLSNLRVGDFNGDGKTDFVKFETKTVPVSGGGLVPKTEIVSTSSILWGCKGKWEVLSRNYKFPNSMFNFVNDLRFGYFNTDAKTDIWAYQSGKMGVFLGGTGEVTGLKSKIFNSLTNDLFFAAKFPYEDQTGIIFVDPKTKEITYFYYGGESNSAPMTMKYNDIENIRFADLDGKKAFEQIIVAIGKVVPNPADKIIATVPLVTAEPAILAEYSPNSLRRVQESGKSALTIDMNVKYYPGSPNGKRSKKDFQKIAKITVLNTNKAIGFKANAAVNNNIDEPEIIGKMENIPLNGGNENKLKVAFSDQSSAWDCEAPRYAIVALTNELGQTKASQKGDWNHWKRLFAGKSSTDITKIINQPPSDIEKIKSVAFELVPRYASVEEDNELGTVEMDTMVKEMNNIAYGNDATKTIEIFTKKEVFAIEWKFELKNLSTGDIVTTNASNFKIGNTKWLNAQVAFEFPETDGLLELKATATISDPLGNSTKLPVELKYWNQRVHLPNPAKAVEDWLKVLKNEANKKYPFYLTRMSYFAEDLYIFPDEMMHLFD